MSKTCNICNTSFDWKKPYDGTKLNADGSVHSCKKTPANKPTITDNAISSLTALAECEAFNSKFQELTDSKYDSLVRLYNTRIMQR